MPTSCSWNLPRWSASNGGLAGASAGCVAGHVCHPAYVDPDCRQDPSCPCTPRESLVASRPICHLQRAHHVLDPSWSSDLRDRVRLRGSQSVGHSKRWLDWKHAAASTSSGGVLQGVHEPAWLTRLAGEDLADAGRGRKLSPIPGRPDSSILRC